MKVYFELSGTTLFEAEMDHVPQVGAEVTFQTNSYKKGLPAESTIAVTVGNPDPVRYVFQKDGSYCVFISANGYQPIAEGPAPD